MNPTMKQLRDFVRRGQKGQEAINNAIDIVCMTRAGADLELDEKLDRDALPERISEEHDYDPPADKRRILLSTPSATSQG